MNYKRNKCGNGKIDNLGAQLEKVLKGAHQGAIETRYRYAEAFERFITHVGNKFGLQRLQNVQDKHLASYAKSLMEKGSSDKYVKTELSAIRYIHAQTPQAKFELTDSKVFNKDIGLGRTPDGRCDRAWTEKEIEAAKAYFDKLGRNDVSRAIDLARSTGTRLDEACTLRSNEVEKALKNDVLHLTNTKGGRPRDIPLTPQAKEALENALKNSERGGYVITPQSFANGNVHGYKADLENFIYEHRCNFQDADRNLTAHNVAADERAALTFHGLRHLFAREEFERKIEEGLSRYEALREVAQELGHNRAEVTLIYTGGK